MPKHDTDPVLVCSRAFARRRPRQFTNGQVHQWSSVLSKIWKIGFKKIIAIDLSSQEDSKIGQFRTFMMTGLLFKNKENTGKLRLDTPLGLSGHAC